MTNIIKKLGQWKRKILFPGSTAFWEKNYKKGGTSGYGSYGKKGKTKAKFINKFLKDHPEIQKVIEFGCGDGNQISLINYPEFWGIDVSKTAVNMCNLKFAMNKDYHFRRLDSIDFNKFLRQGSFGATILHNYFDLSISLDVLGHLVEEDIWKAYIDNLRRCTTKYILIHGKSENDYRLDTPHCISRDFVSYIEKNTFFKLVKYTPNPVDGEGAGFYIFKKDEN